jgi:hypothetical protein
MGVLKLPPEASGAQNDSPASVTFVRLPQRETPPREILQGDF